MVKKTLSDKEASWQSLVPAIRGCTLCAAELPYPPNPILQGSSTARIVLISQAPGSRAHQASRPFADASGDRLRAWLGLPPPVFYDATRIAIMPMAFCYPGTSGSGDRLPPPICSATWHRRILGLMPNLGLTLLIGRAAQSLYLPEASSMSAAVAGAEDCTGDIIPLPHPSWHNNAWLAGHPWFETRMLPRLRQRIAALLAQP